LRHEHTPTDRRRTDTDRPRDDAYSRERADASAGWRAEYAAQEVDPDLRADGGAVTLPSPGDRATDTKHGDELLVVETRPDTSAADYPIDGLESATVADVNDEYDPDAAVVEAVYPDELTEALDGWRSVEDIRDAISFGAVNSYAFPNDRVSPVGEGR
jgi:hypothetical protein